MLFALSGRICIMMLFPQGVALGYVLIGLSARIIYVLQHPPNDCRAYSLHYILCSE